MRCVILFVKSPEPGRVKTRLAATLGPERAAEIYASMVEHVCAVVPRDAAVCVMFDPPEAREAVASWLRPKLPHGTEFVAQCPGDLGARLSAAFAHALASSAAAAAIGTDCVEIDAGTFRETWSALESADCVVGPAEDGGYYLIAMKRPLPELFQGIAWSTGETLSGTLERADRTGLSVHLLPILYDVDTESEWTRAQARLRSAR